MQVQCGDLCLSVIQGAEIGIREFCCLHVSVESSFKTKVCTVCEFSSITPFLYFNMATSLPLAGKVIAITGAASGIGLATAHLLASRGATLSLADLQEAALSQTASKILETYKTHVHTFVLDVRSREAVDSWIVGTVEKFGRLDGAANLAGVIGKSIGLNGIADTDEDEWSFIIAVNLTGVMHCMRAQMKVIADGGSIVNAASIAGLTGRPNNGAYAASKHGVIGLTRSAAKEIGIKGVRVNSIAP